MPINKKLVRLIRLIGTIFAILTVNTHADFFRSDNDTAFSQKELGEIDAMSHYAWGAYLAFDEIEITNEVQKHYLAAIQNDPNSDYLIKELLFLWSIYAIDEENELVIKHLSELARENPDAVNLNLMVANTYIHMQKYTLAEKLLLNLFDRVEWSEPLLVRELVVCYLGTGAVKKAYRLIRKATDSKNLGGNYSVEHTAAVFYNSIANSDEFKLSQNDRRKFRKWSYTHAINAVHAYPEANRPKEHNDQIVLVSILLAGNHLDQAISYLSKVHAKNAGNADTEQLLAECYESANQLDNALVIWQGLSNQLPSNPLYHLRIGALFKQMERFEDALLVYTTAYHLSLDSLIAFEIAAIHLLLNQPGAALNYARKAPPEILDTYILQAYIYRQMQQNNEALEALLQARRIAESTNDVDSLTSDYYLSLATVYYTRGEKGKIISTLHEALEKDRDNPELNNFLGYYWADENENLEEAERLVSIALSKDPENPAFLDSMAWVYFRTGKLREAAEYIKRAIDLQKDEIDGVILDHAGDIQHTLGNIDSAIEYWKAAIKNRVDNPENLEEKIRSIQKTPGM